MSNDKNVCFIEIKYVTVIEITRETKQPVLKFMKEIKATS